jgi:hypothetical protein
MPQSLTQKAVNNFVRGLITEAAELTFPDGASVDELNCDLRRDGTRRRRLGAAIEDAAVASSFSVTDTDRINTGTWENVGGNPELEFLVVQRQNSLYFYNKADLPYSAQEEANSISLSAHEHTGSTGSQNSDCQFASLKGKLVVSSPDINTIFIEYDPLGGTFTATEINFKIRDFEFQADDTTDYFKKSSSATVSDERIYDTLNSGWAEDNTGQAGYNALSYFRAGRSNLYPPLTIPWFAGKNASNVQDTNEFEKIGGGTSLSGNGRYILDFFNQSRNVTVASDGGGYGFSIGTGLNKVITTRFSCVESFSGRIFYAGLGSSDEGGKILFSKVIENDSDFGACHQINDPTSEYFSDLLDTDGGVINIPDAINISKLYALQSSIYVFAENGVWQINGVDGVFKATAYSVSRVSRVGILSASSFVSAENAPFWWSRFGIHTLTSDPVSGAGQEQNLTISTIQTFWDAIGSNEKLLVKGVYDSINKRIYWGYPNNDETKTSKINNFLILDIPLQAFYPWRIEDSESNSNYVVGLAFYSGYGAKSLLLDVTTSAGDDVVTSAGFDVVSEQISPFNTGDAAIVLLIRDTSASKLVMGGFTSKSFLDWGDAGYVSYAETGYDFIGDLVTKKNTPYLVTYARLTEEGFSGNEFTGYEPIRPSSLLVSTAWDFKETFSANQQAYRLKYPVVVNPNNPSSFDYPDTVITTRLKIRGHGRSMRIRYESEAGKDFLLLGWGVIQGRNPRY